MPKSTTVVPEAATRGKDGRTVCGSLLRGSVDRRCQDTAVMENGRCQRHGGKNPKGLANPLTKTGRYSRDLPTQVAKRYAAALADPELLSVRDDIALLQGEITGVMAEIKDAEAQLDFEQIVGTIESLASNWKSWEWSKVDSELQKLKALADGKLSRKSAMREIRGLMAEKASLIHQENRLLADRAQMITVEQYVVGMRALGSAVRRLVDDPQTLRAIDAEFRRISSVPERTA